MNSPAFRYAERSHRTIPKVKKKTCTRVQPKLIKTKALMQGFIVSDYADRFSEGAKQLAEWLKDGKLHYEETITEGFSNIPDAFLGLFKGENKGKQIIKVSDLS